MVLRIDVVCAALEATCSASTRRESRTRGASSSSLPRAVSRMAFGLRFMFSPVSAKTDVKVSQTAMGTFCRINAKTQWKSPRSRQLVSKKMPRSESPCAG